MLKVIVWKGRRGSGLSVPDLKAVGCLCGATLAPRTGAVVESWPLVVVNGFSHDIQFLTWKASNPSRKYQTSNWNRFGKMAADGTCSRPCSSNGGRTRTEFWSLVQRRLQWINGFICSIPYSQECSWISLLVLLYFLQTENEEFWTRVPGGRGGCSGLFVQ